MSSLNQIRKKLKEYKKRYYRRQLLIGSLFFLIVAIAFFLAIASLEHSLWMGTSARGILFYLFLLTTGLSFIYLIIRPLSKILNLGKELTDETAASEIAQFFPEIQDRLLNVIQLGSSNEQDNAFITAAIDRKADSLKEIKFKDAVDFTTARKYIIGFGIVLICFFLVSFINPKIISDSPSRVINYSTEYVKESPFQFILLNEDLDAFKGEDFEVQFQIAGEAIPDDVQLQFGERYARPASKEDGTYSYTFERIQSDKAFRIVANGFSSPLIQIRSLARPDLLSMNIVVNSPSYTGGEVSTITNTGNLILLEGSEVTWNVETIAAEEGTFVFNEDSSTFSRSNQNLFVLNKRIGASGVYQILLRNEHSLNKSELSYELSVIKDEYPKITADFYPDSLSYQFITVAGSIADDYGFSRLSLNYRLSDAQDFNSIPLEINASSVSQSFYANWSLDTLDIMSGDRIELYVSVSDNDRVNGVKTSKSKTFVFHVPSKTEVDQLLAEKAEGVKDQLDEAKEDVKEISERLSELEDRLKTQKSFDWQEKKMVEDVIQDREALNKQLDKLQKESMELQKTTNQFKNQSTQLQEKNEKLQELMDQLMDEETRKLYEKLKELLKQNAPKDQISDQLKQLQRNEQNLERDMERALELFKRLKMESALEENLQQLDSLSNRQEEAAKNEDLTDSNKLQEEVNEEFDNFREKMDEVMKMNQELKRPEALDDFEYEERQIAKELREIEELMKEMQEGGDEKTDDGKENQSGEEQSKEQQSGEQQSGEQQSGEQQSGEKSDSKQQQRKGSQLKQKQQKAAQQMKNLSQKLSSMQGGMQMEMMQANLDQLRDVLDNLVKLSFNQEEIMEEMRRVNQSDPRFLELSQNQLKLKDDAKVIQDSLLSLASRVVQISSFVTREVDQINVKVNETIEYLKDRNRSRAITSQQFAMTSINNLALLLDDTMQQMQMAMSEAMGSGSEQKQEQQGIPDMQELQNQLGQQINELKGSGKSGRELSEELARLAAEQEMIRQQLEMLKEMEEGRPGGGQTGEELQRAIDMMEQNEVDLVNKRLTEQLIFRQKQIQTRLLEADKSKREQETEGEREAQSPSIITREVPPEFEEYLRLKKKEIELLKTIPIELNPFYKKEVNDYFRRISSEDPND